MTINQCIVDLECSLQCYNDNNNDVIRQKIISQSITSRSKC